MGNKIDLDSRQVAREKAEASAKELGLQYFEASAKENIGITELFKAVAKQLPSQSG